MQVYFFTDSIESSELNELESRIRSNVPSLRKLAKLDEATSELNSASANQDQNYIILPLLTR